MAISIDHWKCPICQDILDGDTNGMVSLSRRCYHVFHKTCIEGWLAQGRRTCPTCNLNHFSVSEIVLNPEHTQEYQRWHADPEHYSYEQSFQEEYDRSSEDVGMDPENILRPIELRDLPRRDRLTPEEISQFHREMNAAVQSLGENATPEQIEKARREIIEARNMALDSLQEGFADLRGGFADLSQQSRRQGAQLDHQMLLSTYYKKVDILEKKIINKFFHFSYLEEEKKPKELIDQLKEVRKKLIDFHRKFRLNARIDERTIEESQELLRQIDAELDAFIASQPEDIREILEAPPPVPTEPSSSSSSETPPTEPYPFSWQLIAAIGAIFSFVAVIAYQFRECLCRRFWGDRTITQQNEL